MPTVRIPLIGSATQRDHNAKTDQLFVNCFAESIKTPSTGNVHYSVLKRPGLKVWKQLSAGIGRGMYSWNNNVYYCIGNKLYRNDVFIQELQTSSGKVGFTEIVSSNQKLLFVDGVHGYVIDSGPLHTIVKIVDIDFPSPHVPTPIFADGYVFLINSSTGYIQNSDVENPLSWAGLGKISAEIFADTSIALQKQKNNVVVFGESSVEFFTNSGAAIGSPLQRIEQAVEQIGCASINSIAKAESIIMFVAQSKTGGRHIASMLNYQSKKVSTEPIERLLDFEGAELQFCDSYYIRTKGHLFYVLSLQKSGRTIVYDLEEGLWYDWTSTSEVLDTTIDTSINTKQPSSFTNGCTIKDFYADISGTKDQPIYKQKQFVGCAVADGVGFSYVLDRSSGTIYELRADTYQDADKYINVHIQTSRQYFETSKRKFLTKLEFVGDWHQATDTLVVRFSDDDYQTISGTGERKLKLAKRTYLSQLGAFRHRAFILDYYGNSSFRLDAMELDLDIGEY